MTEPLPQLFGSNVGPTTTPCYRTDCKFGRYHKGPHSHQIAKREPRVGDVVYEPSSQTYGEVASTKPQGSWASDDRPRICVNWGFSRYSSDPLLSEIVIIDKEQP